MVNPPDGSKCECESMYSGLPIKMTPAFLWALTIHLSYPLLAISFIATAYTKKATAVYMMPATNSFTERPTRPNDEGDPVCDGLKLLLKTEYSKKHELRHFIGRFYKMKASTNLRYGDRWKTICECMKSLVYRPFAKETYPILLLALMPGFIQRRIFTIHSYDKVADIKDVKKLIGR